jgi:hypothetical protein
LADQLGEGVSADEVDLKGKSLVWVEYMNVISRHVQARGRTPICWDDMLLGHPQALNRFTRDCMLMHWNYTITQPVARELSQPGLGRIDSANYKQLEPELRDRYDAFWEMGGAQPPRSFYTPAPAVYLQSAGFDIILAAGLRRRGDSYAAPRLNRAIANCVHHARTAEQFGVLGLLVASHSSRRTPLETTVPALVAAAEAAWNASAKPGKDFETRVADHLASAGKTDLLATLDLVGREGAALFNGTTARNPWDRRQNRFGVAPLLGRVRRADLGSLTATSDAVKLARKIGRDARSALNKLQRAAGSDAMHKSFMPAWKYAARETAHKADQWLFLWEVARLVRVDRGSAEKLAAAGAEVLDELRRCQRELKRAIGPSLTANGFEEEEEVRFGHEARLIRRLVKVLRTKARRSEIRAQLADILGIQLPQAAAAK